MNVLVRDPHASPGDRTRTATRAPRPARASSRKTDLWVTKPRSSALWITGFFLVAGGFVPLLLWSETSDGEGTGPWKWMALVAVLSAARMAAIVGQGQPRLYELMFWIFTYLFLGLAPMVQIRSQAYPETTPGLRLDLMPGSAAVVVVGVLSFVAGAFSYRGSPSAVEVREVDEKRLKTLFLPAVALSLFYVHSIGLGNFFLSREELGWARAQAWPNATVSVLVQAAATIPLLASIAAAVVLYRRGRRRSLLAMIACHLVLAVTLTNPLSGPRISFGTVAMALFAIFGGFATVRRVRIGACVMLLGLILVFPYADAFRRADQNGSWSKGSPTQAMTKGDFDSFAQINNTLYYVEARGVTHGRQALGVMTFWMPRQMWPDKPEDTGILLAKFRGYKFENLSAPLWSELYINGGYGAVALGMGGLGWYLRRLDIRRSRATDIGIAGAIIPFYLLMVLRGSLLQSTANFVTILAVSWYLTTRPSSSDR